MDSLLQNIQKYWPMVIAAAAVIAGYVELRLGVHHIAQEVAEIRADLKVTKANQNRMLVALARAGIIVNGIDYARFQEGGDAMRPAGARADAPASVPLADGRPNSPEGDAGG